MNKLNNNVKKLICVLVMATAFVFALTAQAAADSDGSNKFAPLPARPSYLSDKTVISIENTFGGHENKVDGKDLLRFNESGMMFDQMVSDRFQFEVLSEHFDSRIRLGVIPQTADSKGTNGIKFNPGDPFFAPDSATAGATQIRLEGYVDYRPWESINIIAGNKYFNKYRIPGSYLAAVDESPKAGSLNWENGAGFVFDRWGLKAAANIAYEKNPNLNFGLEYNACNVVDLGFTAQNVLKTYQTYGAFVSLLAVPNLKLGLGYTYHSTLKTDYDFAPTEHALQVAVGYTIVPAKLTLMADFFSGLNSNYCRVDTDDQVCGTYVSSNGAEVVPFVAAFRMVWAPNEIVSPELKFVASRRLYDAASNNLYGSNGIDNYAFMVFPSVTFNTGVAGQFIIGCRVRCTYDKGFDTVSIPIAWKYNYSVTK